MTTKQYRLPKMLLVDPPKYHLIEVNEEEFTWENRGFTRDKSIPIIGNELMKRLVENDN